MDFGGGIMKPLAISNTYDWAIQYLNYCVKEGALDPEELENLDEKATIDLANRLEALGDAWVDSWKESHDENGEEL